jgi:hypothetical protein
MADTQITSVVNTPSSEIASKTFVAATYLPLAGGTITGTLTTQGALIEKITTATDTYTVLSTDETVICNKATAFTVTLPTAVVGQRFNFKNIGAGTVTLEGDGTDTIDGDLNQAIYQWEGVQVRCYASNKWSVL